MARDQQDIASRLCGCVLVLAVVAIGRRMNPPMGAAVEGIHRDHLLEPASGIEPGVAELTVLLAVNPGCVHCTNSMRLYARVIQHATRSKRRVRVVVAADTPVVATKVYLNEHGVRPDAIIVRPSSLMIRGTPTVLVVNSAGKVLESWLGEMNREQEHALLRLLS